MYAAGVPCHVIQRGNNRQACFYTNEDYQYYLEQLEDACRRYKVALHAYVLMTNHVHFLMTPEDGEGISKVMQSVGRRYVQYINKLYRRSGTLWEGRHKASLIDAENYLLTCYRYIELNPVAAGMVDHPAGYRWSSYHANAQLKTDPLVRPHDIYLALGLNAGQRAEYYRALFSAHIPVEEIHKIENAAECSMPLGNSRFKQQIEEMLGRKTGYQKRGRPRKLDLKGESV
jgi:putative transposase